MISKILSFDWALWFFWIMATTLGWLLGRFILPGISLVTSGFLVSVFQWLVLQGRIFRPWRWIIATTLGWTSGYLIALFLLPPGLEVLEGLVIGLITGIAQWIILRSQVQWAGWWIIFSVIGWVTGLTLVPGILSTGTMAGSLTGLCLEILARFPKRATPGRSPV
ncbi:MAG TPA: hypothetical protein VK249_09460 [Anaerolineales bacterium]|nr:hypothetical protein [Anaerolineales bacterium]